MLYRGLLSILAVEYGLREVEESPHSLPQHKHKLSWLSYNINTPISIKLLLLDIMLCATLPNR